MEPRSAIPKVVGILMIIFATLALVLGLRSLVQDAGGGMFGNVAAFKTWNRIELVFDVVGLAISALHLYAGFRAMGYKTNAPRVAFGYGVISIVVGLIQGALLFAWIKPMLDEAFRVLEISGGSTVFGGFMMFALLLGLAWPILVIILMTRPAAKAACVNEL